MQGWRGCGMRCVLVLLHFPHPPSVLLLRRRTHCDGAACFLLQNVTVTLIHHIMCLGAASRSIRANQQGCVWRMAEFRLPRL